MKKRMDEFNKKILATLLALIMVFGVLSVVIPDAFAVPETVSLLSTTPPTTEDASDVEYEIEDEEVPLGSGLNDTNGSWSVYLLIPIVLTASLAGLICVRILVAKKTKQE